MFKQSSASGERGDLLSGHLVLLNKPTIDSRLRTGTGGGKRLPPKKTIQVLCTLHHICKKMEITFSVWRKDIKVFIYTFRGVGSWGVTLTGSQPFESTPRDNSEIKYPVIVTATLLGTFHDKSHGERERRMSLVS